MPERDFRSATIPARSCLIAGACAFFCSAAAAGSPSGVGQKNFEAVYTPVAPAIDGRIDDAVWRNAPVIDDMHEVDPIEYSEPQETVVVRVLYDEDNLYVAVDVRMRDTADMTAFRLAQGSDIQEDDRFKVIIDPYNNERSGYDFRINPNGVREEGLFGLLGRPNTDWNGIWDGKARLTEYGWTAEMAIPFKTLNFDPDNTTWGISFSLNVNARNEQIAWTSQNRVVRPGTLGTMTGVARADQGVGLDIVPSLSVQRIHNFTTGRDELDVEPSLDVFYKLTPELTAALTVNTDFSAAEVDDRVVNLERFPVFFPEKRAFFLQDADIYSFAGIEQNGIPFFSRRIGLSSERAPVDIRGGAKLTGRVGPVNLGILDVVQDGGSEDVNLFVGRGFVNVLDLSTLGFIFTNGAPDPDVSNSVTGVDFNYINRDLFDDKGLQASLWYLASETDGLDSSEEAYGVDLATSRAEGWFAELRHERLGRNYRPALGFVNRNGIRDNEAEIGYRHLPRDGLLQSWLVALEARWITDLAGRTESEEITFEPVNINTNADDRLELLFSRQREVLVAPFEISDGVVIAPDDYSWNRTELVAATGDQRKIVLEGTVAGGGFYDGDRQRYTASVTWQPSKYFAIRAGLDYNDIDLPAGEFITRLATLRTDVAMSSTWSWNTLAQYDNESDTMSVNSRLRWIPRAGREMILVVNHGFQVDEPLPDRSRTWRSLESNLVAKLSYTFRY
ncbi:MAG: DUF5916 domain-containing protein [Woeseiaceae bacterium]|nr:DUF5916 domain-containing protein [Woeseiaceae bacterium]